MDYVVCEPGKSLERFRLVEISNDGNSAESAQRLKFFRGSGHCIDTPSTPQQLRQSQTDVAASDN